MALHDEHVFTVGLQHSIAGLSVADSATKYAKVQGLSAMRPLALATDYVTEGDFLSMVMMMTKC